MQTLAKSPSRPAISLPPSFHHRRPPRVTQWGVQPLSGLFIIYLYFHESLFEDKKRREKRKACIPQRAYPPLTQPQRGFGKGRRTILEAPRSKQNPTSPEASGLPPALPSPAGSPRGAHGGAVASSLHAALPTYLTYLVRRVCLPPNVTEPPPLHPPPLLPACLPAAAAAPDKDHRISANHQFLRLVSHTLFPDPPH